MQGPYIQPFALIFGWCYTITRSSTLCVSSVLICHFDNRGLMRETEFEFEFIEIDKEALQIAHS